MQNQAPSDGGNAESVPQNPEILSDEQMHARAAEIAQQIYEQQIAAMRAQRERQRAYAAYTQAYNAYANAYNAAAAGIQNPQTAGTEESAAEETEEAAGTGTENAETEAEPQIDALKRFLDAGAPEDAEETGTPEIEDFPEESDETGVPEEEFSENDETEISDDESAPEPAPKRVPAAAANRALKVPSAPIETALVSLYYIASRLIVAVVILFCVCLLGFLAIVLFSENPRCEGLRTSILSLFEIKKDESAPADADSAAKSAGIGIPDPARKSAANSAETAAVPDPAPENFDYFSDDDTAAVPAKETPEAVPAETGEENDSAEDSDDEEGEPGVVIETDDSGTADDEDEEEDEDFSEEEDSGDDDSEDDIFGDDEDEAPGSALLF